MTFIHFSLLIAQDKPCQDNVHKKYMNGHPCFIPWFFAEESTESSSNKFDVNCEYFINIPYLIGEVLFYPTYILS
jgi:hypothetical protein